MSIAQRKNEATPFRQINAIFRFWEKKSYIGLVALIISFCVVFFPLFGGGVLAGADVLRQEIDFRSLIAQSLSVGELPFWNPYVLCGTPQLAAMSGGSLHPLHLALSPLMSPVAAINFSVAISMFLAGFGAWLFAFRFTASRSASLAGGALFVFSGVMMAHLDAGHISLLSTYALFPWVALALDRLYEKPSVGRLVFAAFTLALFVYSGHPQMIIFGALSFFCLLILRSLFFDTKKIIRSVWVMSAASLGAFLAAPQWIPSLLFAMRSGRSGVHDELFHRMGSFVARDLIQFFAPAALRIDSDTFPWETCAFIGVVGLSLVVSALLSRRRLAIILIAFVALAVMMAMGPFHSAIPGLSLFRVPGRFIILASIFSIALAILGLHQTSPRSLLLGVGIVAFFSVVIGLLLTDEIQSITTYSFRIAIPLIIVALVSFVALRSLISLESWRWLIAFILLVELVVFALPQIRMRSSDDDLRLPEEITQTIHRTQHKGRALLLDPLALNAGVRSRILTIGGYIPAASERFRRYFALASGESPERQFVRFTTRRLSGGMTNLGMSWIIAPSGVRLPQRGLAHKMQSQGISLYALSDPIARARILRRTTRASSAIEAAFISAKNQIDNRTIAALENDLPKTRLEGKISNLEDDKIIWKKEGLSELALDVNLKRAGLVVLADSFDPGWQAWSNHRALNIIPIDGTLIGLYLGKGHHLIKLRYRPVGWLFAVYLMIIGLLIILALSIIPFRKKFFSRSHER